MLAKTSSVARVTVTRVVRDRAMRHRAVVWAAVIAVSALVAHSYGYRFGVANQTTYFPHALQHAHPELFHHDWLLATTNEYHALFGIAAGLLFRLDDSGVVVFGVAHVVLMVALLAGVFVLVRATTARALAGFLLLAGWLLVNGERSLAGSYVWSGYLQPSLIGAIGWIFGLACFVRGRPLATGVALAIGGLFHVNFLLLGMGAFGMAELVAGRDHKALALLLAPQLVAAAVLSPEILAHATSHDPARALWVLERFHAPVHYHAYSIARAGLVDFVRWFALVLVAAPIVATSVATRRLLCFTITAGAICTFGTLLLLVPAFATLTRLYPWRLAPFAILAAQLVIVLALDGRAWLAQPWWRRVAGGALFAWIALDHPIMGLLVIPLVAPRALIHVAVITLAWPLWQARDAILHPPAIVERGDAPTAELFDWAATTPVDATFITPPELASFRLIARRATYVDLKSPPLEPDGLLAWHDRLVELDGAEPDDKIPAHVAKWAGTTGDELLARAARIHVDYLVLDRTPAHEHVATPPVFQNSKFLVFQVRCAPPRS